MAEQTVTTATGEVTEFKAAAGETFGVFVFAGYAPATGLVKGLAELNEGGYIVTDSAQKTNVDGLYAAGDVCIKPLRQVVTAVGDGALAATELEKYAAALQRKTGLHPAPPVSRVSDMPAAKEEVAEALEDGIELMNGWGPKEVLTENGRVKAVVFKRCTSVYDEEHRFSPKYDEDDTITVPCENLLLSIGQSVIWGDLLQGTKVELNRNGTVKADPLTRQTAEPDIFA